MKNSEIYKRLYKDYSKKYINKILISVFFGVLVAASTSAIAWLLDPAIKKIFIEKDQSLIEIRSKIGLFDKAKKITTYENSVSIKNKNYLITANSAKHFSAKNLIIINGNVVMKDLTMGLSHIAYCDTVEINTITNNAVAFMNSSNDKVIAKKFK